MSKALPSKQRPLSRGLPQEWKDVFNTVQDAIWVLDNETRICQCNRASLELFQLTATEMIGRRCCETAHRLQAPILECPLPRMRLSQLRETAEMQLGNRWMEVTVDPIFGDDGQIRGAMHMIRDITDRRQAQEQRIEFERRSMEGHKTESLSVLAGGVAHDFNNLLLAITGNVELVLDGLPQDSPHCALLHDALSAARRAASLTLQMLAFSGKGRTKMARVCLNDLVRQHLPLFEKRNPATCRLELDLTPELPRITADEAQVQQVLSSILINAQEALGDRPGTIRLRTGLEACDESQLSRASPEPRPAPGLFVVLEVADTGDGMDEPTQQRLFEPFFTTKFPGRGLGMAAALGIVRSHRGAIQVESAVGLGTTVRVLFPLSEPQSGPQSLLLAEQLPAPLSKPNDQKVLLLADDDPLVLQACTRILHRLHFSVLTATNGLKALELFRLNPTQIEVVLLDIAMPIMDGLEACRAIHFLQPQVPIILSSGCSHSSAPASCEAAGAAGYLQKPYSIVELHDLLSRVTQHKPNAR
jgi:two-component system, cell cycle sensor histidine kinase and response regulator CckA